MIHEIDDYRIPRQGVLRVASRVLGRNLVEEIEQRATHREAELVVGEDVEEGNDLVDICLDAPPGCRLIEIVFRRMFSDGCDYCVVGEQRLANECLFRELETINSGSRAMESAKRCTRRPSRQEGARPRRVYHGEIIAP